MTTVNAASAPLVPPDSCSNAAIKLGSAGLRRLGEAETADLYKELRDRVEISAEAKSKLSLGDILKALDAQNAKHLSDTLAASEARQADSAKIKSLADQLYAEAHAALGSYSEPTPYAVIKGRDGTVVGTVNQGGGVAFNSDWLAKNGAAQLLKAVNEVWTATDDGRVAKKAQFDILKKRLPGDASIALTGIDVVPPPFGGDRFADLLEQLTSALAAR